MEMIPLDAEKHTETPLMEGMILRASSLVIAQHSDPYRKIGNIQVLLSLSLVDSEILDRQSCLSRLCIAVRV